MSSFSLTETWKTIAPSAARPAVRRTKIVCTLGPATTDPETIFELAQAGMDVARLNFSHGSHDEHLERLASVRVAQDRLARPIAVLADLCGPKIRVAELREPMQVTAGDALVLTSVGRVQAGELAVSFAALIAQVVAPGDEVLIDDGRIRARAEASDGTRLLCRVEVGGTIKPSKGVNLPSSSLPIPALTEKDRADLAFALAAGAD
ncbi:MAG TPA: pyruvate kinase, partial [Gaiellaceae bacterium]|nr:pyruvate kinase [Gaiellaceae bacterium]